MCGGAGLNAGVDAGVGVDVATARAALLSARLPGDALRAVLRRELACDRAPGEKLQLSTSPALFNIQPAVSRAMLAPPNWVAGASHYSSRLDERLASCGARLFRIFHPFIRARELLRYG